MNIEALAALKRKRDDILQLGEGDAEKVNTNLDALFISLKKLGVLLDAYEVDLTADVTGNLPLANLTGGTTGLVLMGNGTNAAPSYQANVPGIPVVGGETYTAGRRIYWWQHSTAAVGDSTLAGVGPAMTVTGGGVAPDTDGYWARPLSAAGGSCGGYLAVNVSMIDQLPKFIIRLRTPATITNRRIIIGLTETAGAIVNTDTPATATQKGIYLRYSTSVPDGGWVCQTVDSAGRTVSSTILAFAASTIYRIVITVSSLTSVSVDVNGTAATMTTNIPDTGTLLCPVFGIGVIGGAGSGTGSIDVESIYLESN